MGLIIVITNSCKKDENSGSGNSIQQSSIVQNALKSAGIKTYDSNTPPNLEGLYTTTSMTCYDGSAVFSAFFGQKLNSIFKLYGQTSSGSIYMAEQLPSGQYSTGKGCYITGYGKYFTIWQDNKISTGGRTALVFSGTLAPNHDLISVKSLTVYTEESASGSYKPGNWYAASGTEKRLDPPPPTPATIILNPVIVIPFSSAQFSAKISDYGSYADASFRSLCFYIDSKYYAAKMGANDVFSLDLSDIVPGLHECYAFVMFNNPFGGNDPSFKSTTQSFKIDRPVLTTSAITNITQNSATCGGNITSDAGYTITSRGVCWSTNANPTITNNKTTNGSGIGSFISNITGLQSNTTYYVRAYAATTVGTAYGNEVNLVIAADNDGNVYKTIQIGTQLWMQENLKTTKYRNGDPIANISDGTAWSKLSSGAYCDYDNLASNSTTYGRLYNWLAVNDSRNIAPQGWHVATTAEWRTLENYLGGKLIAGCSMKEKGFDHWDIHNTGATNSSGFTALPGGIRYFNGDFMSIFEHGYWWASTEYDQTQADICDVASGSCSSFVGGGMDKLFGFSIRCIKD